MFQSFRTIRFLQYLALIAFETTLAHLAGSLLTIFSSAPILQWPALFGVAAISALVTLWIEPVNVGRERIRPVTAAIALLTVMTGTWLQAQGAAAAIVSVDDSNFLRAYFVLGTTLWVWWRGARTVDMGHGDVVRVMRNGIIGVAMLVALLGIGGVSLPLAPTQGGIGVSVGVEMIAFLALGLMCLSLTRIVAAEAEGSAGAQWRWLRSSMLSTIAILLVGLLLLAIVAEPARMLLRGGLMWGLYGLLVIFSPLFWLIFQIIEWLRPALVFDGSLIPAIPTAAPSANDDTPPPPSPLDALAPLLTVTSTILLLIPLVALVVLILLARRRRGRTEEATAEERESIFSWSDVGNDLAGLLRGLRRPRSAPGGLRAALRRLAGADAATRVRRRYIQLLLAGETAGATRSPAQTPHEFAPALTTLPVDQPAVATLTETYERARYAPESVDAATADQADAAWQSIAQAASNAGAPKKPAP